MVKAGNHDTKVIQYGPNIVRVLKGEDHASFSVIMKQQASSESTIKWNIDDKGNVTFMDKKGNVLLKETSHNVTDIKNGVDAGKRTVSQTWRLDTDEPIYGLGQQGKKIMNQRDNHIRLWNVNREIYIPYFTSVKGYGLYWDNAGETWFDDFTDKEHYGTTFKSSVASGVDYYFIYKDGTQDGVIDGIRQLTGQATMFPLWTMGYWQCRERYRTPDELSDVLDEHRKRRIPLDGIVQDWQYWGCDSNWNSMRFENPHYLNKIGDEKQMRYLPYGEDANAVIAEQKNMGAPRIKTPKEMIDYVHENNAHLMITIWPDFGPWTPQYKELDAKGMLYPFNTWPMNRGVKVYDAFNPKARDIYWKYLRNLYSMDLDAWWTDSTEPDHFEKDGDSDFMTYCGSWRSVKNAFSLATNKGIYEHQRAQNKKNSKAKRSFQMTRSGAFGIQHYATFSWSGDIQSTWSEMKAQIPSALNYVICGIPYWSSDLGGFFCWSYNNQPKDPYGKEINTRWIEWGTFMPLMRNHCSSPMVNEIYRFGDDGDWAYESMKKAVELRYRLLPYIYSTAGATVQHSEIMMRPFVMDFPKDKTALNIDDEYMFGRNLLVKPVTDPLYTWQDENKRGHEICKDIKNCVMPVSVYLPTTTDKAKADKSRDTRWYNFWTNEVKEGGRRYMVEAPIDKIPVFVKEGTILPWGPEVQYSSEKKWDNLEIRVYPGADGTFTLYEDEGDGYAYEKGAFTEIVMTWDEANKTLTISDRKGSYEGMLSTRTFNVRMIGGATKNVSYSGKQVKVKLI